MKELRKDIQEKRSSVASISNKSRANAFWSLVKLAIPTGMAISALYLTLGYLKHQQPTTEAFIIESNENRIIYEYTIYGKTLRRLQKTNGIKENLKPGDKIDVHYLPRNPFISIYNPPYFYVPWIHSSSAKEVEYV